MEKTNQIKQADIRERNLKNVYTYVLHHPGVSRAKIAKALELSRPSSSSLVDELLTMGAIFEDGKDRREGGLGRIPIQIKADFRHDYAIVLFWQSGKIDGSIVSLQQGKPYSERRMAHCAVEVPSPKDFGRISLDLIRSLRDKQEGRNHYIGTGIVLPGIVDRERKCILSYPLGMDIESGKEVISELEENGATRLTGEKLSVCQFIGGCRRCLLHARGGVRRCRRKSDAVRTQYRAPRRNALLLRIPGVFRGGNRKAGNPRADWTGRAFTADFGK